MSQPRINRQIRRRQVQLIDQNGTRRGIVPLEIALDAAEASGMDLVEIAPMSNPPGVRIMNRAAN